MSQTHRRLRLAATAFIEHLGGDCATIYGSDTAAIVCDTPQGAARYTLWTDEDLTVYLIRSDQPDSVASAPFRFEIDPSGRAASCTYVA